MIPSNRNLIVTQIGQNEVTRTYKVDSYNKRIIGTTDGQPAIEQAILKNFDTERFAYVIYSKNYGIELEKYIGKDYDFIRSDLQRAIEECLLVDARIYSINNLQFTQEGLDYMSITMDIETEQGVLTTTLEVKK
nr:MAG TPA: Protein of unknown function (DUF2634) [Caudoviricetes sp.]